MLVRPELSTSGAWYEDACVARELYPRAPSVRLASMNQLPHKRRYVVAGIDQDGDVQAFAADDQPAADEIREQMSYDLIDVQMVGTVSQNADVG